jgi:hypothetical protein
MKLTNFNIRNFGSMYLASSIGSYTTIFLNNFNINSLNNKTVINLYVYNQIISQMGGIANFSSEIPINYLLTLNEIIYDSLDDLNMDNLYKKIKEVLDNLNSKDSKKIYISEVNLNSIYLLDKNREFQKSEYNSLIFIGIPFALRIHDKKILIQKLDEYLRKYINDNEHVLSVITIALFINYAMNDIAIEIWLENINNDLREVKDVNKYLDYINNYEEINFRNKKFVIKLIEEFVNERNMNFITNHGYKYNKYITDKPREQVLIIYDTLIRSKGNWEKNILFGICNFNDNIIISLVIGILYEIMYNSAGINKKLLKRFSFNL